MTTPQSNGDSTLLTVERWRPSSGIDPLSIRPDTVVEVEENR